MQEKRIETKGLARSSTGESKTVNRSLYAVLGACAVILSFVALGGIRPLLGQGAPAPQQTPRGSSLNPARPETVPLKTLPVKFDQDYGAAIARLGEGKYGEGRLYQMDATLVELPPGGKLAPHKHLYEEMIYIVSGRGYTNMWMAGTTAKKRYDWSVSDVLSPSLNAWHETVNSSSTEPARLLLMTSFPLLKHKFGDAAFSFSSDYPFEDRWKKGLQEPKFLEQPGRNGGAVDRSLMSVGHIIRDMANIKMPIAFGDPDYPEEGINVVPPTDRSTGVGALAGMAGNRLFEWQKREVIRPDSEIHGEGDHHHAWEVVYYCPKGELITYLTRQGKNQPRRTIQWQEGDLMIVEANEIHQHGLPAKGARFLQFKPSGYFRDVGIQAMFGSGGW